MPLTAMTGLGPKSAIEHVVAPVEPLTVLPLSEIRAKVVTEINTLREELVSMHKAVSEDRARKQSQGRRSANRKTQMAQFDIGDYVLYADVWARAENKLSMKWCGPACVTGTSSNWIFRIKNLITLEEREVHASRLKVYADSALDVTGEILEHVAHNSEGHVVDRILGARYNASRKQHELHIRWRGLAEAEDSWEPALTIYTDVKAAVRAFFDAHLSDPAVQAMASALGIVQRKRRQTKTSSTQGGSVVPVPLSGTVPSQTASDNRRPTQDAETATPRPPTRHATRTRKARLKLRRPRRRVVHSAARGDAPSMSAVANPGTTTRMMAAAANNPVTTAAMMAAKDSAAAVEAGASTATSQALSPRSARRADREAVRAANENKQ